MVIEFIKDFGKKKKGDKVDVWFNAAHNLIARKIAKVAKSEKPKK